MKKMLSFLALFFVLVLAWKGVTFLIFKHIVSGMINVPTTVSSTHVYFSSWSEHLEPVATLRAKYGINLTTEMPGMVEAIYFNPGAAVKKNQVLLQLTAGTELGQLDALSAQYKLAELTYQRDKEQFEFHAISKQVLDGSEWNLKNLKAQIQAQSATVAKKTIRAPFSGYTGIINVSAGQYLNPGDPITSLQALDQIYADFYIPQQYLSYLKLGQSISLVTDAYPEEVFNGFISAIDPNVNINSRNIQVEASIDNTVLKLKPGIFAVVKMTTSAQPVSHLTLPQTALVFNSYGNSVYLVVDSGEKDKSGKPLLTAKQVFVTVGDTRKKEIAILSGLKEGDEVVTSGQLKLKNGAEIEINNSVQP